MDTRYYMVIEGEVETSRNIVTLPFDLIFFTGSPAKGRLVAMAAAENLTPCLLELGGKNPTIVDHDAELEVAAMRIVQGKFTNSGQTCIAPDYVLAHKDIKDRLLALLIKTAREMYPDFQDMAKIVN
jgi:aldehyde dehydrogenase (NAD+)